MPGRQAARRGVSVPEDQRVRRGRGALVLDSAALPLPAPGERFLGRITQNSMRCVPPDSSWATPSWSPARKLRPGKCQRMSGAKYWRCRASMSPRPNARLFCPGRRQVY